MHGECQTRITCQSSMPELSQTETIDEQWTGTAREDKTDSTGFYV